MKRLLLSLAVIFTLLSVVRPGVASAHVLAENNGVSAVLHIPPFDSPQAGAATTLEFELGSSAGAFQLSDYKLQAVISDGDQRLVSEPVPPAFFGSASLARAKVTFPQGAVYTIVLQGTAVSAGKPDFSMSYNVRVVSSQTARKNQTLSTPIVIMLSVTIFLIFIMLATGQIVNGKRYKAQTSTRK